MHKAHIKVSLVDYTGTIAAVTFRVPNFYMQYFKPLASADDPFLAAINGECLGREVIIKTKLREDAANDISAVLTKAIIEFMERKDTHNGFPIKRSK